MYDEEKINAVFQIPTNGAVVDAKVAVIKAASVKPAPVQLESDPSDAKLYQELSAISEEVIKCRQSVIAHTY